MKSTNNPTSKKVLTLNKVTVSMFSQTSIKSEGKNQAKNDSVSCLPTTSSFLV